jgi:hypothetical protein
VTGLVGAWILGATASLLLGQDRNGDQQIAHVQSVWTLLHPDQDVAFAPAAWLPGTVNVPWFLIATHAPAWAAIAFLGAFHATALWLVGALAWRLLDGYSTGYRFALTAISVAFTASGAVARTEFGTTFADLPTAIPILAAMLAWTAPSTSAFSYRWRAAGAGLALGISAGLKLSNLVFVIGFAAAGVAFPASDVRGARFGSLWRLVAGAVTGAVLSAGWFWWVFYQRFGNPIFPFFNGWWKSPYAPSVNVADTQYIAETPLRMLLEPWLMAAQSSYPSERAGRDLRWALLATGAIAACLATVVRRASGGTPERRFDRRAAFLFTFIGVSWLVWTIQFGIARYLIVIEALSGVALVLLTGALLVKQSRIVIATLALLVATVAWVRVPDFDRRPVPDGDWFGFSGSAETAQADALVILADNGYDYMIAAFPADATSVTLPTSPGLLRNQTMTAIASHEGPIVSVTDPSRTVQQTRDLVRLGLRRDSCHFLRSHFSVASTCSWVRH